MWKITDQKCEDEYEQESGQIVLDKGMFTEYILVY